MRQTIEEMENIFLAYNDRAIASGILHKQPELGRDLKAATESFIQLAKKNHGEPDSDESDLEPIPLGDLQHDYNSADDWPEYSDDDDDAEPAPRKKTAPSKAAPAKSKSAAPKKKAGRR